MLLDFLPVFDWTTFGVCSECVRSVFEVRLGQQVVKKIKYEKGRFSFQ
jgi:hypothetical protein